MTNSVIEASDVQLLEAAKVLVKQTDLLDLLVIQRGELQKQIDTAKVIYKDAQTLLTTDVPLAMGESKAFQVENRVVVVRKPMATQEATLEVMPFVSASVGV